MSPHLAAPSPDRAPLSSSLERALARLAQLRCELALDIHLASSDARETYRVLEPKLRDLGRFRDGTEGSVEEVRELLTRAGDLRERIRHAR